MQKKTPLSAEYGGRNNGGYDPRLCLDMGHAALIRFFPNQTLWDEWSKINARGQYWLNGNAARALPLSVLVSSICPSCWH